MPSEPRQDATTRPPRNPAVPVALAVYAGVEGQKEPESDADALRVTADWLDRIDDAADAEFEKAGKEHRVGRTVQNRLRSIADRLDATETPDTTGLRENAINDRLRHNGIPLAKWLPSGKAGYLTAEDYAYLASVLAAESRLAAETGGSESGLRAAQMAVFERWFGPPADGTSAATRRAIIDELEALATVDTTLGVEWLARAIWHWYHESEEGPYDDASEAARASVRDFAQGVAAESRLAAETGGSE